ncbi:DEAD/DEAH box helicase [Vibrio cyclitrophicus]|uniref:DEAD/DEAH box helicase n=1 Tax=Vibrio cyclitrophicus TaxID=47951 RepID=UPI000310D3C1|nr:DEAD/DEAH box helicase [Vibrio cyclitrophicus]OED90717.1 ATP-dependent RNA helicase [Vibrio cyclitrophicus ZF30]PME71830.1 ATP-dependent RNA helicase [Vibrio cyclitrophicus]PMJ34287.1 ATP-dependent RNA helicase [Vibrio cyclitrophicus]PMK83381.1 ATP-dependent RNA helicase [Vibrio cyclitrophicus]PMP50833.1 ATP-dependent RNA helicase [Vibrio cyclitrophicus]
MSFTSLGLSEPILKAIEAQGYDKPSPIQEKAVPAVLTGKDVMAAAQTGTGKTAGFTLPILEMLSKGPRVRQNQVRALVLTPTRELAAQVNGSVVKYGINLPLTSTVVFGGVKINPQMQKLRKGSDVLVATPGRLLDLYNQNAVRFDQLEILVLDEADRMLDMGFIRDIRKILAFLPKKRQNLLFSATFSDDIRSLAKGLVNNPVEISVSPANSTAKTVEQSIYPVDKKKKSAMLAKLIKDNDWRQVLVFSKTKHGANKLARFLEEQDITAAPIHGNKSQGARTKALENFKTGKVRVLVATDIAARGIDIPQLPQVVNFDLPHVSEDYVHRIGRTGRAGEVGKAISLVCADEVGELFGIERLIQQVLERRELEGFSPVNKLPESRLDSRPIKPKKPKKPREHSDGQRSGENARGHKPAGKNKRHVSGSGSAPKRKPNSAKKATDGNSAVATDDQSVRNNGSNYKRGNAANKPSVNNSGSQSTLGKPNASGKPNNSGKPAGAGKPKKTGYVGSYGSNKPSANKPAANKPSRSRAKPAPQK